MRPGQQGMPQAEQAEAERPEGPTEDELEAAGLGYPLHKEEAVKLWYSGFRSEVITVLEAWEAIGHDIGMNPDKGELLDSLRYMLEKCEAHDAALAEVAGLRSLLNSLLCYVERDIDRMRSDRDKSDNKEIYDRSISLAMERLKAAQNAVFTTEPGCDTAVKLAAQTTQAQHSVPEEFSFEYRHPNGESHTVTVSRDQVINEMPDFLFEALCSKFCNCEPAGETNVVECCCDEYAEEFKLRRRARLPSEQKRTYRCADAPALREQHRDRKRAAWIRSVRAPDPTC